MEDCEKKHYYQYANPNSSFDPEKVGSRDNGYRSFSSCGTISDDGNVDNITPILQDSVDAYLVVCLPESDSSKVYKIGTK